MKSSFENWESIHGHGDILTLSQDREGLLWLKLKSIMRKDIIKDFIAFSNISLRESKLRAQFEELFYYCSKEIVNESIENPKQLMTWLYENQGEMRFGSENRLFLILVDKSNFYESWKLKRNFEILRPTIYNYLERFTARDVDMIDFSYNGNNYKALADTIFIIK